MNFWRALVVFLVSRRMMVTGDTMVQLPDTVLDVVRCPDCGEYLEETPSRYWTCPRWCRLLVPPDLFMLRIEQRLTDAGIGTSALPKVLALLKAKRGDDHAMPARTRNH